MNVYVVTDLEGVAGVGGYDVYDPASPHDTARRERWLALWAAEVSAAVRAAQQAGATRIVVLDNHSSGDSLPLSRLPDGVELIHGGGRPSWLCGLDDSFDALLIIGQHGMAGGPGHLRHTYSRRRLQRVMLNGTEIGEAGLIVGIAGELGVPVVALSGDDAAAAEFTALVPKGHAAIVKQAMSRHACRSFSTRESQQRIETAVVSGLEQRDSIAPVCFDPPLRLALRYHWRDGWRAPARWLRGGLRDRWWGPELRLRGNLLGPLWDRGIGTGRG